MMHVIVPAYHSFKDPIVYGLLYKYLLKFQSSYPKKVIFHLITFEHSDYSIPSSEIEKLKKSQGENGLKWYPIPYHTGGKFILFKKAWDFILVFLLVVKIKVKYPSDYLVGFTSISCVIAYQLSRILRMKAICLNMEPHSEYMREFGIWEASSLKYKILKKLEQNTIKFSFKMALPTRNACNDFDHLRKEKLDFLPTCIEFDDFNFSDHDRASIRKWLGISEEDFLVLYLGKFDGIYFSMEEMVGFLKGLNPNQPNIKCLIITPDDLSALNQLLLENNCDNVMAIGRIEYEELSGYISAADAGLLVLPEYPSQRYRCPIKTANYLACGTPIIVNEIVGDDPHLVTANGVGWVVNMKSPKIDLNKVPDKERCIKTAQEERNINQVVEYLHSSFNI